MEKYADTNGESVMLRVTLKSPSRKKVRLSVSNPLQKNTFYCDREEEIQGTEQYYVRMPISPKTAKIVSNAEIASVEAKALRPKFTISEIDNYMMKSFVFFAQDFAEQCGYKPSGYRYTSDDGIFAIKYVDQIVDNINGQSVASNTPCRISADTGEIEVNASRFRGITIPMRMALLLHEYCHFYKNENPESELEADRNSLFIYLGLGYPRYEAYFAWLETFDYSTKDNDVKEGHKQRLAQIKNIIDTFDEKFTSISFIT